MVTNKERRAIRKIFAAKDDTERSMDSLIEDPMSEGAPLDEILGDMGHQYTKRVKRLLQEIESPDLRRRVAVEAEVE